MLDTIRSRLIAIAILAFRFLVLGRRRGVTTAAAPEPVDRTPPAPGPAAP